MRFAALRYLCAHTNSDSDSADPRRLRHGIWIQRKDCHVTPRQVSPFTGRRTTHDALRSRMHGGYPLFSARLVNRPAFCASSSPVSALMAPCSAGLSCAVHRLFDFSSAFSFLSACTYKTAGAFNAMLARGGRLLMQDWPDICCCLCACLLALLLPFDRCLWAGAVWTVGLG